MLGTDQSGYSKIENGVHSLPVSLIATIANFYQITTDELLGFELEQPRSEYEKAIEKLDGYKVTYRIGADDWIEIPISQGYCFRVSAKKLPLLIARLEQMTDDSLREARTQVFKAVLFDYLLSANKTD